MSNISHSPSSPPPPPQEKASQEQRVQALTEQLVALREEAARREAERESLEHAMEALRKVQLLGRR